MRTSVNFEKEPLDKGPWERRWTLSGFYLTDVILDLDGYPVELSESRKESRLLLPRSAAESIIPI